MPFAAVVFVIAGLASMGMPGFSGFPAELTILIGTWQVSKAWALVAAFGVLVAAAFTLRVMQVSFFGQTDKKEEAGTVHPHFMAPITWPERAGAFLLLAATLLIGLQPDLLLNWIGPSLQSPLMQAIWHGGTP
jgi:NADH-quinone oxidoreductase subunit M